MSRGRENRPVGNRTAGDHDTTSLDTSSVPDHPADTTAVTGDSDFCVLDWNGYVPTKSGGARS